MNTINRTGIEGFDFTFNPVRGCLNDCEGKFGFTCWAREDTRIRAELLAEAELKFRKINSITEQREYKAFYYKKLKSFSPVFLEAQFTKDFPKKPARIIVGWESDIAYWQPEWMERVLGKIREYPQHTFFFLTKKPEVYAEKEFPLNCWLGTTLTGTEDKSIIWTSFGYNPQKIFISIEPLLRAPMDKFSLPGVDWIIIGAQTGSGDKVIPKREWVEAIINQARLLKIPVYLKDNLLKAVPGLPRLKEIPG